MNQTEEILSDRVIREVIKKYVKKNNSENEEANKIYKKSVNEMEEINLDKITEKQVEDIIKSFLWEWGNMARVVGRKKDWQIELSKTIKKYYKELEIFRKKNLVNVNLSEFESDIKNLYNDFCEIIKQVATAKILHLICPNFFPLWDNAIANAVRKEANLEDNKNEKIKAFSKADYYQFMQKIQNFAKKYEDLLSELAKDYDKTKLKILDDFLWYANKPLFLFFNK